MRVKDPVPPLPTGGAPPWLAEAFTNGPELHDCIRRDMPGIDELLVLDIDVVSGRMGLPACKVPTDKPPPATVIIFPREKASSLTFLLQTSAIRALSSAAFRFRNPGVELRLWLRPLVWWFTDDDTAGTCRPAVTDANAVVGTQALPSMTKVVVAAADVWREDDVVSSCPVAWKAGAAATSCCCCCC